ncbi:MAG TPA: protein kinase [Polyangiaceae bacterium]|nr:protein kinase [Polyangiaceae bacterium]
MNAPPSRVQLDSLDLLDWDLDPASPATAAQTSTPVSGEGPVTPPSGDAPTLRSDVSDVPDSYTPPRQLDEPWDPLAAGGVIDGKYRLVRELGRGAMGVVVMAHDETLDRNVAVKLIQAELTSPGFKVRFLEEARAMARVNHRNVVQIYACGEHGTVPYFVMELVEGTTAEEWLERQTEPLEVSDAVRLLAAVCEGVSAIHAADTLHRDIKPSNILLDAELHPRVADFGVSTYRSRRASRPEVVGTPAYMAPEIAFPMPDEQATQRADVYSLACVAYELLTGEQPFSAENDRQYFFQHATTPVRPPSTVRPDLPKAFDRVLLNALAKDPNERTPTVEAFRRDLLIASEDSPEPVRILVAEDDEGFRDILGLGLTHEFPDAEVICVPDGAAALDALRNRSASVAILDLNMPGLDGLEVTRRLRDSETTDGMPIIVLTGSGGPAEWRELSSLGADRFLVKPVGIDEIVTAVRQSLRKRSRNSDPSIATPPSGSSTRMATPTAASGVQPKDEPLLLARIKGE